MTVLTLGAILALSSAAATSREFLQAVEDAARTTVTSLAADSRVKAVKSIAFVKLGLPDGKGKLPLDSNVSQVFEATLTSKAQAFTFVTHSTHTAEWKLIDEVFDQANDFSSYDPKTHPELLKLKLADALLFGQIIDAGVDKRTNETETSVYIALRLLKISTGEQIWGGTITGRKLQHRDVQGELTEKLWSMVTFENILYAAGGIIGLLVAIIVIAVLIKKMTRVR